MSFRDSLPNTAAVFMAVRDTFIPNDRKLKDKDDGIVHLERLTPDTIAAEINYQVESMAKGAFITFKEHGVDPGPADAAIGELYQAKNTVDAIRLNGRFAKISEDRRLLAAQTLAKWIVKPVEFGTLPNITPEDGQNFDTLTAYIAAKLGHKDSMARIQLANQRK